MNDYTMLLIYALFGQIMPQVSDLVNKHIKSSKLRFWASMAICFLISLIFNFNRLTTGGFDAYILDALVLWGSGQAAYKNYYDGSVQQQNIRFTSNPLPLKELVPDVKTIISSLPIPQK